MVVALFAVAVGVAPAQQDVLVRQGLVALQSRDIPKAREFLERAIEANPDESRAWIALAQAYRFLNLHRDALRHAEEAARLGRDEPIIQHALAMFYTEYGQWAKAAEWEERFAGTERGSVEAAVRTISLYLQADMPLRATEVGRAALERHGGSGPLHSVLGKAYTIANLPEQGLRHLTAAVEAQPYEESMHHDLGYFHLRGLDFRSAEQAFLEGRKYFDKSAALEVGLGIAAFGQRRFQVAVDRFLHSAELAPRMVQPHVLLGALLPHASHRMDDVESRLRAFYEEHSDSHFGPFLYGKVLNTKLGPARDPDRMAGVEALLRESIERNDEFWEAHYELGVLLERKRELPAAQRHLERAADLNPNVSKPRFRLARIYQKLGKAREARREREQHRRLAGQERQALRSNGLPRELAEMARVEYR